MRTNLSDVFTPAQRAEFKPKIVARNTFRYQRPDGTQVIRLHRTDIVEKRPDGSQVLNTGGWKTITTKDRLNTFSDYRVDSRKGVWTVTGPEGSAPYYDGIVLPQAFRDAKAQAKGDRAVEAEKKLAADIKRFVKLIPLEGDLPLPNDGDCWYCRMKAQPGSAPDRTHFSADKSKAPSLGDATGDHDHLRNHIREGYMHGSLIANALQESGYPNLAIAFRYIDRKRVRQSVAKYLRRRLGLAV